MKLCIGDTPITAMNVVSYDVNTDDATVTPASMQAGVTAYAKGTKITGTGKAFKFASYGTSKTNQPTPVPTDINVIEVASTVYPIQMKVELANMKSVDFSTPQTIGTVTVDGATYNITAVVADDKLTVSCQKTFDIQLFYGKDEYV